MLLLKKDYLELMEEHEEYSDKDIFRIYISDELGNKTCLAQNDVYTSILCKFGFLYETLSKTLNW